MAEGSRDAGHSTHYHPTALARESSPLASRTFLSTLSNVRTTLSRTSHSEVLLRDDAWPTILKRIHGALDTGKPITGAGPGRGLPMDVVVQTLKASWHVDGTWPIDLGAMKEMEEQSIKRAKEEKGPEAKQDPSAEDVARMYSKRGVEVREVERVVDDDW